MESSGIYLQAVVGPLQSSAGVVKDSLLQSQLSSPKHCILYGPVELTMFLTLLLLTLLLASSLLFFPPMHASFLHLDKMAPDFLKLINYICSGQHLEQQTAGLMLP